MGTQEHSAVCPHEACAYVNRIDATYCGRCGLALESDGAAESKSKEPQWKILLVFCLLLVGLQLAAGPKVRLSEWEVAHKSNHGLLEAKAWRAGRLHLVPTKPDPQVGRGRPRDTAYRDGKVYNVFPPLFTFISTGVLALQDMQGITGAEAEKFYAPWYVMLVALPLPVVGFWAFRNATGRSEWAAVLTAYWILGTPLLKMLVNCQVGEQNEMNHVLSNTGLLLIIGDLFGRRRIWPSALGLLICVWTRQLTILYLPAMAWAAWTAVVHRWRGVVMLGASAVIGLGALAVLNQLRFGSVWDTGYSSIYAGRNDMYARRAALYGRPFDPRFIPRNAYWMNLALPELREVGRSLDITGEADGASIWITSPLLLFALWDWKRWWREPARRWFMLCSFGVILAFLSYHNTGSVQRGFYRFALDFIPVWLAVIGQFLFSARRVWITAACLGWSGLYFHLLS